MAKNKGKRISSEFKAQVALEAAKGAKTASEIASEYPVHPTQISQWKRQLLDGAPELFQTPRTRKEPSTEELTAPLYEEIGRLKIELDFLQSMDFSRFASPYRLEEGRVAPIYSASWWGDYLPRAVYMDLWPASVLQATVGWGGTGCANLFGFSVGRFRPLALMETFAPAGPEYSLGFQEPLHISGFRQVGSRFRHPCGRLQSNGGVAPYKTISGALIVRIGDFRRT